MLPRHYPGSSLIRASPPPDTARPAPRGSPVGVHALRHVGLPVLRASPCTCMPSPLPRRNRWVHLSLGFPSSGGLPRVAAGSASASLFSRPAQRSLTLRPACSPITQGDPLHRRLQQLRYLHHCSDCYRLARPVAGRESHPLKTHTFARHTATRVLVRHERVLEKRHMERRHGWASEAPADERAGKQIGRS